MHKTTFAFLICVSNSALASDCAWIEQFVQGVDVPEASQCQEKHCRWDFEYRADAGRETFKEISHNLTTCLGEYQASDDPVNHPDSYDLQQFPTADTTIYLSLKDKASLGNTFVFLRRD